ncbi:MAG: glycosyltransferase family 2 protein [Chitinophagales bacterium]
MSNRLLSVLVPVFNEERIVKEALNQILEVQLIDNTQMEIIVVDDGSSDKTVLEIEALLAEKPNSAIRLIQHGINKGKGAALHTGIKVAKGDYIVVQDADMEYDPNEFNILLAPVINGRADVVFGSRFIGGNPHRILFFWHSLGNKWLTFLSNAFTNLNLTDMETCYKLFRADILKSLDLKEKRFGFEPEVTAKMARIPEIRVYEVGISYYGRTYAEGKKINWKDGFRAIYCILKYGLLKA